MSTPYLSEIRLMSFVFPPKGWALCNGQLLAINQNQALFSLLGTTYGGNGTTSFGLPDLRDRVPVHQGAQIPLGARVGEEAHTLTVNELPQHGHVLTGSTAQASTAIAGPGVVPAASVGASAYGPPASLTPMSPDAVASVGGNQPHENMPPFLTLSFCIALQGIFPSRN